MCRRGATFAILHLGFFLSSQSTIGIYLQTRAATGWQAPACHSLRVLFQHGLLRGVMVLTAASLAKAFSHQIPHHSRLDLGHISVV